MIGNPDDRLLKNLSRLAALFYKPEGLQAMERARFQVVDSKALGAKDYSADILLVSDDAAEICLDVDTFAFGSTEVAVPPAAKPPIGWVTVKAANGADVPWFRDESGTLMPSFPMWSWMRLLLSHGDEGPERDKHGRFPMSLSPRHKAGLLHVPHVNECLALLLDAACHTEDPAHELMSGVAGYTQPPAVVLSHDLDNLVGNDRWSQLARLVQVFRPPSGSRPPDLSKFRSIWENFRSPLAGFFDDQLLMWELEAARGFNSVSYVLSGEGGRYGARTPFHVVEDLLTQKPDWAEIGIHYNYGTLEDPDALSRQRDQIELATAEPVLSGRAHYLRFDPAVDYPVLRELGITVDESVGWVGHNSYRSGIAGPFNPLVPGGDSVLELPMMFSDRDLWREDGSDSTFTAMLKHVAQIGGCLSVLVHPGAHDSEERPEMRGVYEAVLDHLVRAQARSLTPMQLSALWHVGRGDFEWL